MRKGIRVYVAGCHFLQAVVSHRGSCAQRGFDIALLKQSALLRGMRPDSGETIRLQFHFHGEWFLRARILFLQLPQFSLDAQNVLDVMAKFVRDHVGLGKFAGSAETPL